MEKITAVQHIHSWVILTKSGFIMDPQKEFASLEEAKGYFWKMRDIENKGSSSDGIIDTAYYSPSDYGLADWGDDDDTTDDYQVVEILIKIKN